MSTKTNLQKLVSELTNREHDSKDTWTNRCGIISTNIRDTHYNVSIHLKSDSITLYIHYVGDDLATLDTYLEGTVEYTALRDLYNLVISNKAAKAVNEIFTKLGIEKE